MGSNDVNTDETHYVALANKWKHPVFQMPPQLQLQINEKEDVGRGESSLNFFWMTGREEIPTLCRVTGELSRCVPILPLLWHQKQNKTSSMAASLTSEIPGGSI